MNGWIKIHRQLVESEVWLSEPFSRSQAWVDLICLANHKEGFIRTKKGTRVKVERGQVGYSQEALAKRWQWSRGKVRRYLSELEKTDLMSLTPMDVMLMVHKWQQELKKG